MFTHRAIVLIETEPLTNHYAQLKFTEDQFKLLTKFIDDMLNHEDGYTCMPVGREVVLPDINQFYPETEIYGEDIEA